MKHWTWITTILLLLPFLTAQSMDCKNECPAYGVKVCNEEGTAYRKCIDTDSDPCLEFSEPVICQDPYEFTEDVCVQGECKFLNPFKKDSEVAPAEQGQNNREDLRNTVPIIEDIDVVTATAGKDVFFQIKTQAPLPNVWTYEVDNENVSIDSGGYFWWKPTEADLGPNKFKVTLTNGYIVTEKEFIINVGPKDSGNTVEWHFEFWAMLGFFAIIALFIYERHIAKIHRTVTVRHIKAIDDIYNKYREEPEICAAGLKKKRTETEEAFEKGHIDEKDLELVLLEINKYLKQLRQHR